VTYRHTQIGWAMIVALGVSIAFLVWMASFVGSPASVGLTAVTALLVVCLVLFISQTVIVDDVALQVRVGPGLIRRRVALEDIETVGQQRLPWWAAGYGIRMSLNGKRQLWRVSGSDVVDLGLADGRRLLIATDEPEALATVVRVAIGTTR
jgi:hypothetical protein